MTRFLRRGAGVVNYLFLVAMALVGCCAGAWGFLSKTEVHADKSVLATVNVADTCTMSEIIDTPHTAVVPAGTYKSDIGLSTFRAYCNDNEGFAIYAIGYTDETEGKNVLTSSTLGPTYDIAAGALTSGDSSQWAMKLAAPLDPTPTYPISVESDFSVYHAIPSEYALVAKRTANTDNGANAEGSVFTSTYQAYIFPAQPAGTYQGKVKYVLVHPSTAPTPVHENQIGVLYDGNGSTFPGGASTNRVVYEEFCEDEYGYIADEPLIMKTRNLNDDGTSNGSYEDFGSYDGNGVVPYPLEIEPGPSRLKIVVRYGLTAHTTWDIGVDVDNTVIDGDVQWWDEVDENRAGVATYVVDVDEDYGSSVGIHLGIGGSTESGYDYGVYAQVYPIYDEPTEGATYGSVQENVCSFRVVSGAYTKTTSWTAGDYWYKKENDSIYKIYDAGNDDGDYNVKEYLKENSAELMGTTITLYALNYPYRIIFNGNGATAGSMSGVIKLATNDFTSNSHLLLSQFEKTGYGFAGWGVNQNATVNSTDKIYGPNERVVGDELTFDPTTQETTLYAVWVPSSGTMQNWSGCSSMNEGQVTALTDNRDNNVYTVAKLPDGNCWMMENLRLDNTATTLSSGNTNNPISTFTSLPTSSSNWCTALNASCINQALLKANVGYLGDGHILYNWYSATAGNGTYSVTAGNAVGDICPVGWSMPTGNVSGQFSILDIAMGGTGHAQYNSVEAVDRWLEYPKNFSFSGWSGGGVSSTGYYWSRAAHTATDAWNMYISPAYVAPGIGNAQKTRGFSVRCLAQ